LGKFVSGECLCGSIKYSGYAEIKRVANCHCSDCQKVTGAAFATIIFVSDDGIDVAGTPQIFRHCADSGSKLEKHFCENCGSQMFSFNSNRKGVIGLRAGTLNQKELIKPEVNVYLDSKIASTSLNGKLPSFAKMPT
jgi:hypothetical protein